MVQVAFNIRYWQISADEPWMEKELFNVVAEPLEEVRQAFQDTRHSWHSIEDVRLREMLQSLLEGRFQLKYRRQTRVGTAYFLERTREPLKL